MTQKRILVAVEDAYFGEDVRVLLELENYITFMATSIFAVFMTIDMRQPDAIILEEHLLQSVTVSRTILTDFQRLQPDLRFLILRKGYHRPMQIYPLAFGILTAPFDANELLTKLAGVLH